MRFCVVAVLPGPFVSGRADRSNGSDAYGALRDPNSAVIDGATGQVPRDGSRIGLRSHLWLQRASRRREKGIIEVKRFAGRIL